MEANLHQKLRLRSTENGEAPKPGKLSKKGKSTRRGGARLLNRESLDGRTAVAKVYDQLVAQIHADLGGRDQLSAVQLSFVEAFAGATVTLDNINTRILAGAEINNAMVSMHASAISAMVRAGSRLGTARVPRDVGPTLGDQIRADQEQQRRQLALEREARLRGDVIDAEVVP